MKRSSLNTAPKHAFKGTAAPWLMALSLALAIQSGSTAAERPEQVASATVKGEFSIDKLQGMPVEGSTGDTIGEISDLIIDTTSGRALLALIETEEWSGKQALAVPFASLSLRVDEPDESVAAERGRFEWYQDGTFTLSLRPDKVDSLQAFELREDIDAAARKNLDRINETFTSSVLADATERDEARLRLATDLAQVQIQDSSGKALPVDQLVIDAAGNGKATYILSSGEANDKRLSLSKLEWGSDQAATLDSSATAARGQSEKAEGPRLGSARK